MKTIFKNIGIHSFRTISILMLSIIMLTLTLAGCVKTGPESSAVATIPTLESQDTSAVADNSYGISFSGKTEYLKTKPSSAKKGDSVTFKAEIPMEGTLKVYLSGEELKPSGTDDNDLIIYEFTMPGKNITIDLRIEV